MAHDPATLKKLAADQRHKKLIEASRKLARVVKHDDPPPEVCKARAKLEKSLPKWLRHHGAEAFCDDWSPDHLKVLKKIQTAIDKGGLFALAMPRGHGKTTILKWVNLYVMLTGKRRYVVAVGATAELAQAMVDFARDQLMESPTLHEHYPHVTTYARATDGKAIKARYQLRGDLKPSGIGWGKTTLTMPTPTGRDSPYPSDGGMIEAHGLTGAIRGKQRDDRSGKVLRPDFVLLDDPQTREALAVDTPIPTARGFVPMGEVAVGDTVFDERGNACEVIGVSPTYEGRKCYRVCFDDGSSVVCDSTHLWKTSVATERTNARRRKFGEQKQGPQYVRKPLKVVRTAEEIAATLYGEGGRNNHSIPVCGPVGSPAAWPLKTKPYTLGAWLGDGDSSSGRITGMDAGVFDRIKADGYRLGKATKKPGNMAASTTILGLVCDLVADGIMPPRYWGKGPSTKSIPDSVAVSDIKSRLDLLRGLMDTDGWCNLRGGGCGFGNTNEGLIDLVRMLCASLGIKTRKRSIKLTPKMSKPAWQVNFQTTLPVFGLARKLARLPSKTKPSTTRRYICGVIPVESVPVKCIAVSSPSRLYLCGKSFIPTHNSAESPSQCSMRERIIMGDVLGLAGPRKKIAAVMPCTVIRKGDLAHRFLDHAVHPEWQGETCALVVKWPDAQDTLWKEYADTYREGAAAGEGLAAATEFYRKNRKAMDAGAEVSWSKRVRDGEISALQTAENLLIEAGQQFWAEYQNDPQDNAAGQYELTIDQILAHATDLPRLHLPERAQHLVGHADINRTGLHWCVTAFDQAMTAHVVAYGNWPPRGELWSQNATAQVRQASIYRGLSELMGQVAAADFRRGGAQVRPSLFLIDASYESETVHRFCESWRGPFRCMPAIGRAAHRYRWSKATLVGRPAEQAHVQRPQSRLCPYVMANVDHWREVAQRAWLAEVGEAGGCTIHAVANPRIHVPFAEHVTAEKLAQKYETELGWRWEWTHAPGTNWDWGDALTGCWVAAALEGLSSGGVPTVRKKKVCRAVISGQISKGNEQPKGTDNEQGKKEQPEQAGSGHPKRRAVIGRGRGGWR